MASGPRSLKHRNNVHASLRAYCVSEATAVPPSAELNAREAGIKEIRVGLSSRAVRDAFERRRRVRTRGCRVASGRAGVLGDAALGWHAPGCWQTPAAGVSERPTRAGRHGLRQSRDRGRSHRRFSGGFRNPS